MQSTTFLLFALIHISNFSSVFSNSSSVFSNSSSDTDDDYKLFYKVFLPFSGQSRIGKQILAAVKVAEDTIREEQLVPDKFKWHMLAIDDQCTGSQAILQSILVMFNTDPYLKKIALEPGFSVVGIGAICAAVCRPLANYFASFSVSFVSIGCNSPELSDKDSTVGYPTAARLVSTWDYRISAVAKFIKAAKWTRVGIIVDLSDTDWSTVDDQLEQLLNKEGIKHETKGVDFEFHSTKILTVNVRLAEGVLGSLRNKAMVFVLLLYNRDVIMTLIAAFNMNMLREYVYIALGFTPDLELGDDWKQWADRPVDDLVDVQEGLVSLNYPRPKNEKWNYFTYEMTKAVEKMNGTRVPIYGRNVSGKYSKEYLWNKQLSIYAALLHDALLVYAYALNRSQVLSAENATGRFTKDQGLYIANQMFVLDFEGKSGHVSISKSGDRAATDLVFEIVQNSTFVTIAKYKTAQKSVIINESVFRVIFPGHHRGMPVGYPKPCGFDKELCKKPFNTTWLGVIIAVIAFIILLIIAVLLWWFCIYKKIAERAATYAIKSWIIDCDEVQETSMRKSSSAEITSIHPSEDKMSISHKKFTQYGFYRGAVVAIRPINRKSVDPNDPVLFMELKQMYGINHENLNSLVGVCIVAPNVRALTAYCKNGSVQDIIQNEEFDLAVEFKISFAVDIAQGMLHLHSTELVSHGHLKSSNCVVDSRWTCKITDFGMGNFRRPTKPPKHDSKYYYDLLWTAPELLEAPENEAPLYGTQKGDVYSYGIILQELAVRGLPFHVTKTTKTSGTVCKDIIHKVKTETDPEFRPFVPPSSCSPMWMQLMTSCWRFNPTKRLTFKEIVRQSRLLSGSQAINIVDNMLERLEAHNQNLEKLVVDRTKELTHEKRKVESILFNILPKSVAQSLMRDGKVQPESFDNVTIYFSDVVGFMKINESAKPHQVVALLNSIYRAFDVVTDKYDVYKCETIGDVYMVASGVPIRNGDRHASEIATMAFHLLSTLTSLKIPNWPGKILQLRIGMHSGSIVAGVIGHKMPYYCLFGDTVNTASRMQSGGLALRIHASDTSAGLLKKTGGFKLESRGEREVKGKGLMTTYWVVKKVGFDMPLPDLKLALSPEEHEFK